MVGVLCVQHMNCWLQHLHELYECPFCLKNCFYFTDWYSTHTITEGSSVSYLSRCDCILLPLKSFLSIHCERPRPSDKEPHKHCKSCLCVFTSMYHSVIHVSCAGLYVDVGYLYVHVSVCLRGFLCLCDPGLKNRKIHREAYYLDGTKSQIPTKEGKNLSGSWVCVQVCKYVWVCVCWQSQVSKVEAEGGTEDKVRRGGGEVGQVKASNIKRRGFLSLCGPASSTANYSWNSRLCSV